MASGTAIQIDPLITGIVVDGEAAVNAKVFMFLPGTVSSFQGASISALGGSYKNFYRTRVYDDSTASTVFPQGTVLDANGRLKCYGDGVYDIVVRDASSASTLWYIDGYECDAGAGGAGSISVAFESLARRYAILFGGR